MIRTDELWSLVTGLMSSHLDTLQEAPASKELDAFSRGYQAALKAVARGAGISPDRSGGDLAKTIPAYQHTSESVQKMLES
jgi:hypothetical protein